VICPSLGPLAGSFPLLSLRTINLKADVVVGIDQEVADRLDKSGELWRSNGRHVDRHSLAACALHTDTDSYAGMR
jgi:hypothetical protein